MQRSETDKGISKESSYLKQLYKQYLDLLQGSTSATSPEIGKNFFPSALLTETERQKSMGVADYTTLEKNPKYQSGAEHTILTVVPLDAGIGSGVPRSQYLQQFSHLDGRTEGAKGCDIHFTPDKATRPMSVMEIKAHRYAYQARNYKELHIQELLNPESKAAYKHFLDMPVPTSDRRSKIPMTYRQFLNNPSGHLFWKPYLIQENIDNIDPRTNTLTSDRTSPGGHGEIGTRLLQMIAHHLSSDKTPRVKAIINGEGINNEVSETMINFTTQENAGIVMITTTKTSADVQGGILGLRKDEKNQFVDIMELAQAKKVGQEQLFYAMGLTTTPDIHALGKTHTRDQQYFNTNMALLNEGLLGKFLSQLCQHIGEEAFAELITPDLIQNKKSKEGRDYIQLEGALGSVLLKLNRYATTDPYAMKLWSDISHGSQFLRIINLDTTRREEFFTPIKRSWDVIKQAHSDLYTLNTDTWKLTYNRTGEDIVVNQSFIDNPEYKNLHFMQEAFGNVQMRELQSLTIDGTPVLLPNATLKGNVRITNHSNHIVDLHDYSLPRDTDGRLLLENVTIVINSSGQLA